MNLSKDVLLFADQLVNGVMIFSPECEVMYVNPAAQSMWPHESQSVLDGFSTGIGERTISHYEHPVMQAIQSNRAVSQTLIRNAGTEGSVPQWIKMTANPIHDEGLLKYVLLSLEDVTKSKHVADILSSRSYMLDQLDVVDTITGLYNSRYVPLLIERTIADVVKESTPLSVCVFDLDHFTRLNESQGRKCGDDVLRYVAALLGRHMQDGDVIARTGGGEFLVMLPSCNAQNALNRMESFGTQLRNARLQCTVRPITVSGGIAEMAPQETSTQLLERADSLLYLAKLDGRDRFLTEDVV